MLFANFVTSLASLSSAILLAAITMQSVRATVVHIQNGNPNASTLTLAVACIAFVLTLAFGMPTARDRILAKGRTSGGRALLFLPTLIVLFVIVNGVAVLAKTGHFAFLYNVPGRVVLYGGFGFLGLFVIAFILPGFAFFKYRDSNGERPSLIQSYKKRNEIVAGALGLPDRENESILSKLARIALGVLAFGLLLPWIYARAEAQFIPNPEHLSFVWLNEDKIIAATAGLIAVLVLPLKQLPGPGLMKHPVVQKLTMVVVLASLSFLAPRVLSNGLPALHSLLGETSQETLKVTVLERGKRTRRKACDRTADISWPGAQNYKMTICEIPDVIWDGLQSGDRLVLHGNSTEFGFRYSRISQDDVQPVLTSDN